MQQHSNNMGRWRQVAWQIAADEHHLNPLPEPGASGDSPDAHRWRKWAEREYGHLARVVVAVTDSSTGPRAGEMADGAAWLISRMDGVTTTTDNHHRLSG